MPPPADPHVAQPLWDRNFEGASEEFGADGYTQTIVYELGQLQMPILLLTCDSATIAIGKDAASQMQDRQALHKALLDGLPAVPTNHQTRHRQPRGPQPAASPR